MKNIPNYSDIAVIKNDINYIKEGVGDIKAEIASFPEKYVTKEEFRSEINPIKKMVYGAASFILLSFFGALAALVFNK